MNIRPSDDRWIDFSNVPCMDRNVIFVFGMSWCQYPYWNWARCYTYRSSFRTFLSFINPRAHSAHNTWTTLWNFRSFSSKTQSSFIVSTITKRWKFSYRMFTYIQNDPKSQKCNDKTFPQTDRLATISYIALSCKISSLSREWTTKALIRLRRCAGWSVVHRWQKQVFSWCGPFSDK